VGGLRRCSPRLRRVRLLLLFLSKFACGLNVGLPVCQESL